MFGMRHLLVLLVFYSFVFSQSLLFDDKDDFISISPSEEVEDINGITISTWIHKEKNSNYEETLIDFGGTDSKDTPYRYIIKFEGNRIKAWVEGSAFDGTNVSFLTCANCLYEDLPIYDQWINIVAVYTPNSSKLYFNGMLIGSSIFNLSAESLSIFNETGNYFIGKNATVKDSYFEGYIDEVAGKINCAKYLGYSIKELGKFWKIGEWYGLDTHPIEKIVSNESIVSFKEGTKLLFNFAKLAVRGIPEDYKIQLPINYIHKKGYQIPAVLDVTISFKPIVCSIKTTFFKTKNI